MFGTFTQHRHISEMEKAQKEFLHLAKEQMTNENYN
jgi:hypothetical protein